MERVYLSHGVGIQARLSVQTRRMEPETPDQAVAALLNTLNKGQYLILAEAIRQLGGELRLDWAEVMRRAAQPLVPLFVDASDGPVMLTLQDPPVEAAE